MEKRVMKNLLNINIFLFLMSSIVFFINIRNIYLNNKGINQSKLSSYLTNGPYIFEEFLPITETYMEYPNGNSKKIILAYEFRNDLSFQRFLVIQISENKFGIVNINDFKGTEFDFIYERFNMNTKTKFIQQKNYIFFKKQSFNFPISKTDFILVFDKFIQNSNKLILIKDYENEKSLFVILEKKRKKDYEIITKEKLASFKMYLPIPIKILPELKL
jgi:hypothetical protein